MGVCARVRACERACLFDEGGMVGKWGRVVWRWGREQIEAAECGSAGAMLSPTRKVEVARFLARGVGTCKRDHALDHAVRDTLRHDARVRIERRHLLGRVRRPSQRRTSRLCRSGVDASVLPHCLQSPLPTREGQLVAVRRRCSRVAIPCFAARLGGRHAPYLTHQRAAPRRRCATVRLRKALASFPRGLGHLRGQTDAQ